MQYSKVSITNLNSSNHSIRINFDFEKVFLLLKKRGKGCQTQFFPSLGINTYYSIHKNVRVKKKNYLEIQPNGQINSENEMISFL